MDEEVRNEDLAGEGFYGYEWPMLWPPIPDIPAKDGANRADDRRVSRKHLGKDSEMKVYEMVGDGLLEVDSEEWAAPAAFGIYVHDDGVETVEIEKDLETV